MFSIRILPFLSLLCAATMAHATEETPSQKNHSASASVAKTNGVAYTFHLDNQANQNEGVDSVWVVLDKFDHSGAGVVKKVFYPDAGNEIVIEDLPEGKYYAEVYVLGFYKKHFSAVINSGKGRKNKEKLQLDYKDVYMPGNAGIPAEDTKLFAYTKQ